MSKSDENRPYKELSKKAGKEFTGFLRYFRMEKGYTVRELTIMMGLNDTSGARVTRIEEGTVAGIGMNTLLEYLMAMEATLEDFMAFIHSMRSQLDPNYAPDQHIMHELYESHAISIKTADEYTAELVIKELNE